MSKYIAKTPIKLDDDKRVEEGDELELTDKQAKPLLASGAVTPAQAVKEPKKGEK